MRVLIVDDSALFRRAARDLLEFCGYRVIGEADCVASGLVAAKEDLGHVDLRAIWA